MVLLKELLYKTVVPKRNKRDVLRLKFNVEFEGAEPSPMAFLGSFLWGLAAALWCYVYVYFLQGVLPSYQFDVHET